MGQPIGTPGHSSRAWILAKAHKGIVLVCKVGEEQSGPPLPGGRLSLSQPEWMDPSPQVLGIRHVTAKLSPTYPALMASSHILYVQVILLVHQSSRQAMVAAISNEVSCYSLLHSWLHRGQALLSPTWKPSTRGLRLVLSHTARDPDPPVWRPRP